MPQRKPFTVVPRLDEDGQQKFGEPEFRDMLFHIGDMLGLHGTYHALDVVRAFEKFFETKPYDMARALELHRRAEEKVGDTVRKLRDAEDDLRTAAAIVRGFKQESR